MLLKILYTLIVVVAGLHAYFMYKEMFDWIAFSGEVAGLTENIAKATIPLGKNQGLYNGFLAAGLVWSLFAAASYKKQLMLFFLLCVLVAGLVGGFTIMP